MSIPLHAKWRDYRARCRALAVIGAAWFPVQWSAPAVDRLTATGVPHHLLAAGWATACVAAVTWFAAFRCPFCAAHFHWTWLVSNPFARHCLHCGFEKWRDPDAGRRLRPEREA